MDRVDKDPVYSGVEDKVEFYSYACYSGDQLQKLLAKAFISTYLIVRSLVIYST